MAIQHRRGDYTDFDPTKMKPGEYAVALQNDPLATDGEGVYMAFGAGRVKRMATLDELHSYDTDAQASAEAAEASRVSAQTILDRATQERQAAERARTAAEQASQDAIDTIEAAEDDIAAATLREKNAAIAAIETSSQDALDELDDAIQEATENIEETAQDATDALNTLYQSAITEINNKGAQIVAITTNAEQLASQALDTANNAENHMAGLDNQMRSVLSALDNVSIDPDDLGLEQDPDTYYVYPTYKGVRSENGIPLSSGGGGGGGGGETIRAEFTAENTSGWNAKSVASGTTVKAQFSWSSIEDGMSTGDGAVRITVNDVVRATYQVHQGNIEVDLTPYLTPGTNKFKIRISDTYDQGRTMVMNVSVLELSISSTLDTGVPFTGVISLPVTPVGSVEKTIKAVVDGAVVATLTTSVSNRQVSLTIPAQSHGGHSLLVYFEAQINGETVRSNELYYEFMSVTPLDDTVIITSPFNSSAVMQYSSVAVPFTVYDPRSLNAEVAIYVNNALVSTQNVGRTEQSYTIKANTPGSVTVKFSSGGTEKSVSFTVQESEIDVEAETEDLVLHLTAQGRSNNEDPAVRSTWSYEDIEATLTGFTWVRDGWQTDSDSINVLRFFGPARATIDYMPFQRDFKATGKTIEIEFATRDVVDYSAEIVTCFADGIGFKVTPQMVLFKGAQTEISTLYKDNEHLRLSITIDKQTDNRLILMYINGILSRAIQYASGERFSQLNPVNIVIGSDDCGIDIYGIRIYDNNLNRQQVLENWIADTQIGEVMLERYTHNNIYDAYGVVTPGNLPADLPYWIIEGEELPQFKGDKKTVNVTYTDPLYPSRSFTAEGVQINVQGTSSSVYYKKNEDLQFKNGFETPAGHASSYAIVPGHIPFNRFVLKKDVASSEGWNNVGLVMFYNDTCPYKTAEMLANSKVRWGIEGIPCTMFFHDTTTGTTTFQGKFNFNLPKRCPAPLGYEGNDESWEFERNNSGNVKFQDDDFVSESWDEVEQEFYPTWYDDFEARFPSDAWRDYSKIKELVSWVKSTWRERATGDNLSESVTYRIYGTATIAPYPDDQSYTVVDETDGSGTKTGYKLITFTKDTAAYRLSKFRAEFADYFEVDSVVYYYIFTEQFLMIDSRAKNMFIGFHGSPINDPNRAMTRKAVCEPYDMDTALGTNNSGVLMFTYSLEDTDTVSAVISGGEGGGSDAPVFNAQDSVLFCNLRDSFRSEITSMYRTLRTSGGWNYKAIEERAEAHQAKWPEAIYNEDQYETHLVPLIDPVTVDETTGQLVRTDRYLTMIQGSKKEQRKWWLYNRFRYIDSKYVTGDAANNIISLRVFNSGTITITPAIDLYVGVSFGGGTTVALKRTTEGVSQSFTYQAETGVTEMETWIYSADLIISIGGLPGLYANEFDFSKATRMRQLIIGSNASGYSNANLRTIDLRNMALLEEIDVRNCPNLAIPINLEGSPRLREAYFDGTAITGIDLADGGTIETLHLPGTITTLTLINLNKLEEFVCPSLANVSRLMLTNIDQDVIDPLDVLAEIRPNSQINIQGMYLECEDADEIEDFLDLLDTMTGVSRERGTNGEWMYHDYDTAQVSGTIHTASLTGAQIASYNDRYPYITVTADHVTSYLTYKSWDGETVLATVVCQDGVPQQASPAGPVRTATAQYSYAFIGWNLSTDADTADSSCITNVIADRTVYAAYSKTVRTYTVTWRNSDNTVLETDQNVRYGSMPQYNGATPTYQGQTSTGWIPAVSTVVGDITYTAAYLPTYTVYFYVYGTQRATVKVVQGQDAVYPNAEPTSGEGPFVGWEPEPVNVQKSLNCYAVFDTQMSEPDLKYLVYTTDDTNMTMTITGLNTSALISDKKYYITIPDTIGGYRVIIG